MNTRLRLTAALLIGVLLPAAAALAQSREDAKLIAAAQVLQDLHDQPDKRVPTWLLNRSYGVAVIPDVLKGAFIVGGRHGTGVLSARDDAGRFSNPVFIALNGGSFGFQAGAEATDVVLVFASKRSLENFARGQITLGATASVAAGPIGRQGEAAGGTQAEVYSYSHARGLFVGVALDGTALTFSSNANRSFYGQEVTANQVFGGQVKVDSEPARRFIAAIAASLSPDNPSTPAAATATAAPAPVAVPAAPDATNGTHTFPMEDPKPGSEPK